MTPLFAATQGSSQGSLSQSSSAGSFDAGMVRATQQQQQFTPTQDMQGSNGSFNWMNPSIQVRE